LCNNERYSFVFQDLFVFEFSPVPETPRQPTSGHYPEHRRAKRPQVGRNFPDCLRTALAWRPQTLVHFPPWRRGTDRPHLAPFAGDLCLDLLLGHALPICATRLKPRRAGWRANPNAAATG